MEYKNKRKYDEIIDLPHPTSKKHPRMPIADRAAQFSPFAALSGYEAAIRETARLTEKKALLSEDDKAILNNKLHILQASLSELPEITVTYFQPDMLKDGGAYITVTSNVKKLDTYGCSITLLDDTEILFEDIYSLQGKIFERFFEE